MGITRDDVFEAATELAREGVMPSIRSTRKQLGNTGSENTINKYLTQWKEYWLASVSGKEVLPLEVEVEDSSRVDKSLYDEMVESKNRLAAELIETEQKKLILEKEKSALNANLDEITEKYGEVIVKLEKAEAVLEAVTEERAVAVQSVIADKNQEISQLQKELAETNQVASDKVSTLGFSNDEKLMEEKVKVVQLQDRLTEISQNLKEVTQSLKREQERNQPLIEKLKKQQDFMNKVLTWEQLQEYEANANR